MWMSVLLVYMYVYHVCAWCPWKSEEGVRSPETGVMDSWEPPCQSWELNPVPLQEQVLLTVDSSLQDYFGGGEGCVCVCLSVSVRERDRETERAYSVFCVAYMHVYVQERQL